MKASHQRRYHGRRRTRARVQPLVFLLALAAVAAAAGFLLHQREQPPAKDPAGEPAGDPGTPPAQQQPLSEHETTASGIPCTRTELGAEAVYAGDLILVNNDVLYHFPAEQELTSIYDGKTSSYYVRDMDVLLAPHALTALNEMMDAFREQGGSKSVNVVAGHRTREFQQHLFDQSAERNGEDHAQRFVAQPGGSEHHTGLVVDFSIFHSDGSSEEYQGTGEYTWINTNCQNYGWIVRYDPRKENLTGIADEPWHFRYVGIPHACAMVEQDLCLEEYVDYLKQFPFDGEHLTVDCGDASYEIWYSQGTEAYVPDSGEYTVSGNNVDGVVVTCRVG